MGRGQWAEASGQRLEGNGLWAGSGQRPTGRGHRVEGRGQQEAPEASGQREEGTMDRSLRVGGQREQVARVKSTDLPSASGTFANLL